MAKKKTAAASITLDDLKMFDALERWISKLDDKETQPDLDVARARVRAAFRAAPARRATPDSYLSCAAHSLHLVAESEEHDFGPDPEVQLVYLMSAVQDLSALVAELRKIDAEVRGEGRRAA